MFLIVGQLIAVKTKVSADPVLPDRTAGSHVDPSEVWCSFCLPLTCFQFLTLTDRRLNCNWISLLQSFFISGIKLRLQPRLKLSYDMTI